MTIIISLVSKWKDELGLTSGLWTSYLAFLHSIASILAMRTSLYQELLYGLIKVI